MVRLARCFGIDQRVDGEFSVTNKIKLALYVGVAAAAVFGGVYLLTDRSSPPATAANQSTSAGAEQGEDHDEGGPIKMTASERAARGIATARVGMRILSDEVVVPGEVMLDLYRSAQVTPRISAQVVARHVKLGDQVKAGQRLVTLSSVEMADAQGALVVATREWQRVRELGRDIVSERRYVEAQVTAEQARAKVLAFGLTPDQATALVKTNDASKATGTFDLLTAQDGTVASDKFVVGEIVAPGRVLFQITDERRVWVEAQLTAAQAGDAKVGAQVRVLVDGDHEFGGHIVQARLSLSRSPPSHSWMATPRSSWSRATNFIPPQLTLAKSAPAGSRSRPGLPKVTRSRRRRSSSSSRSFRNRKWAKAIKGDG